MESHDIDVSVIIVTANRAKMLPTVLAHLEIQSYPSARFEVIVVETRPEATLEGERVIERYAAGSPVRLRIINEEEGGIIKARNTGSQEAQGRWVLFLDDDLLAGPKLVEGHVRAQETRDGTCAVIGRLELHPQIEPRIFTRQYELTTARQFVRNQPLRFPDWRAHNLSLPREKVFDAGGFDTTLPCSGLEDVELALRLEQSGMAGFYNKQACAYIWLHASMEAEKTRLYGEGYSLHTLISRGHTDLLRHRYASLLARWRSLGRGVVASVCSGLCRRLAADSRLFTRMSRLVLVHSFYEGYRDAAAKRPPRWTSDS